MRPLQIKEGGPFVGMKCRACPRKVRPGQYVLHQFQPNAPAGSGQHFILHVACVRRLIEGVPDTVDLAAGALRERILASGDPWA